MRLCNSRLFSRSLLDPGQQAPKLLAAGQDSSTVLIDCQQQKITSLTEQKQSYNIAFCPASSLIQIQIHTKATRAGSEQYQPLFPAISGTLETSKWQYRRT